MNFKLLNKEKTIELVKRVQRPENLKLYKDENNFKKTMYLMHWYGSHEMLDNSVKRVKKLNEIFGKHALYSTGYKNVAFSEKNAVWAFSYENDKKGFVLYYSKSGTVIEITENAAEDFNEILNFLISKMCVESDMPVHIRSILM